VTTIMIKFRTSTSTITHDDLFEQQQTAITMTCLETFLWIMNDDVNAAVVNASRTTVLR
jgi:hypothetical protein